MTRRPMRPVPELSLPVMKRFWSHVSRRAKSLCWLWNGHTNKKGYGRFSIEGVLILVHRIAYKIGHQKEPGEHLVCHSCDVPRCCNPDHLFVGSDADNARDRDKKGRGRQLSGEDHPSSRLTDSEIISIRESKESVAHLAIKYGVTESAVQHVRRNRGWKHLPLCRRTPGVKGRYKSRSKYKGVRRDGSRFIARIQVNKTRKSLGRFLTAREAAEAYDKAALMRFGPEAYVNFPRSQV